MLTSLLVTRLLVTRFRPLAACLLVTRLRRLHRFMYSFWMSCLV